MSIDELTHAIDITSDEEAPKEEKEILKSIIKFGSLSASQIMTSRTEIEALDINEVSFNVLRFANEKGSHGSRSLAKTWMMLKELFM